MIYRIVKRSVDPNCEITIKGCRKKKNLKKEDYFMDRFYRIKINF